MFCQQWENKGSVIADEIPTNSKPKSDLDHQPISLAPPPPLFQIREKQGGTQASDPAQISDPGKTEGDSRGGG